MSEDPLFSWHHAPGYVVFFYVGVKEMFAFLGRIWPRPNVHSNGNGQAAMELRLRDIVKDAVFPMHESIKALDKKFDDHMQWHLNQKD